MIRQIDKSLKNRDNSVRGLMANEIHKHLDLCVERNEDFLGRDVDLYKVIMNSKYVPFVPLTNDFYNTKLNTILHLYRSSAIFVVIRDKVS